MRFSVLSSGSRANSTLVDTGRTRILVDCGLSARETVRRLAVLGVCPMTIDALVVTHEHSDHVRGLSVFSRTYKTPVYANGPTAEALGAAHHVELFSTGVRFRLGDLELDPFPVTHDAADPVGFVFTSGGFRLGQATDLGRVTAPVRSALAGCHAIVLESNHDEDMLTWCGYPWQVKQRIRSSHGHLSNAASAAFLSDLVHSDLTRVVLGHLSENSNTPDHALGAAVRALGAASHVTVRCASGAGPWEWEFLDPSDDRGH